MRPCPAAPRSAGANCGIELIGRVVVLALVLGLLGAGPVWGQRSAAVPVERALGELSRAALRERATVQTWTGIARALRELRPAEAAAVPTEAEEAAWAALDAVASTTKGAVREVRIAPAGPHTEIVVPIAKETRHRLFQRLGDTNDPRLTMVLTGTSNAIVEQSFTGIDRGGVRSLQLSEFGADTVQIAVHLQQATAFMIFRRGEELVLRIENPDGEFRPWSTRPAMVATQVMAATQAAGVAASAAVANDVVMAEATEADVAAAAVAATLKPTRTSASRRLDRARSLADAGIAAAGRVAETHGNLLLLAALALTIFFAGNRLRRHWQAHRHSGWIAGAWARWQDRREARRAARAVRTPRAARTARAAKPHATAAASAPARHQTASRIWAARTLAANGASPDEIARKTGLARDAVVLLAPTLLEQGLPAENAAGGTFFPPPAIAGAGAAGCAAAVRH